MKNKLMKLLAYLIIVFVSYTKAVCRICGNSSGVMCLSFNTFQICSNGISSGSTITCPSNTACSDTADICASPSTISADCPTTCGTCSLDLRYACINSTAYALCFGSNTPNSRFVSTCATNSFCDITATAPAFCSTDSNKICSTNATTASTVSTASTTLTSTTATTASTSTTVSSVSTSSTAFTSSTASTSSTSTTTPAPSTYCTQLSARDKTRYSAPWTSNCKWYIFCFQRAGSLNGSYYQCLGSTIFNNQTGYCVNSANYTCPTGL